MAFEYKVVPAPTKGLKARGVKSGVDRFANALETKMNELAADGWDYQRTDTLPCEEREGLMGKTTVYQNMLVFRRLIVDQVEDAPQQQEAKALPAPELSTKEEPHVLENDVNDDAPTPSDETNTPRVAAE